MSSRTHRVLGLTALVIFATNSFAVDFGRTAGTFDVAPSGAATYTIPIWTPPGPNGVQPALSLSYNSQGGNGLAGVGWNVNAVSSIERCNRTKHQDGNGAAVELSLNDRFCIGGNRLRLASGTYGLAGSVYYTELADYSRITAFGTAGNGPQYFTVETKSGLKYEYGNSTSSRVLLGSTALRWMLNKVYDRNGNNYVVSYNNGSGFAVPDVISWTPTSLGSASYRYEAKFNYTSSRADPDSYLARIAGFDVSNRYRLENIQIKSAGTVVRKYRLTYDTSSVTSRSRLTSAKECADDAESNCFLPITFGYQAGQAGVTGTATSGISSSSSLSGDKYDFNGDGKSDLLHVTGSTWKVAFSTGTGFGAAVDTGVSSSATFAVRRFLANQQDGLLVAVSGSWNFVRFNGSTFVSDPTGTPANVSSTFTITDTNGDGLSDLLWTSGGDIDVRLNTSSAAATVPTFSGVFLLKSYFVDHGGVNLINAQYCPLERICDHNGDGRADLSINVTVVTGCGMSGCSTNNTTYYDLVSSPTGYTEGPPNSPIGYRGIKFNDDRCIDRLNAGGTTLLISGCGYGSPTTVTLPATAKLLFDWNGDGADDVLVDNGGTFGVYLSNGNPAAPFSALIPTSIPVSSSCSYFVFDPDGDGFDDIGCRSTTSPFAISYFPHGGSGGVYLTQEPDLINSIVDGFGVSIAPSYVSTSQNNYTRGTGTQLPLLDATAPVVVVAQVSSSNGIGSSYTKSYSYVGARENGERGEYVGFQRVDEVDSRNGLIGRTYFDQLFPISGMVSQTELMQPNGTTPVRRTVNVNASMTLDGTANNQRYFPYPSTSTATEYEVAGTWNGALLSTTTTTNVFETIGGTLYDQTVTTVEPASGANGVNAAGSWTARTVMPTANLVNDTTNWCLGRPQLVQQTNSNNLTYGTPITRTTNLTWNVVYCRPTQTVAESGSGTLQVTTDVGYDGFGNVNSTLVTGVGMNPRSTTVVYSDATFTTGQFPLSVARLATATFSETTTFNWNYDLGVPLNSTDPNGLLTSWSYDPFGRRTGATLPDLQTRTSTYNNCTAVLGGCLGTNNRSVLIENAYSTAGTLMDEVWTYADAFDRPITAKSRTLASYSRVDREYDALGRIYRESAPCDWTSCTTYWNTNGYDLIDRLTSVSRPISDSVATPQTTTISYLGLTTLVVDPQNKQSHKVMNAAGQLARSKDNDGYFQSFEYDAFGGVKLVQDSAGNALQSSIYNVRGMLTSRTDLDMGTWSFTPNALGETASQTDAKGQVTSFSYDRLGRLTGRSEAEGSSSWTFGITSANKDVGQIIALSGPGGYSETWTYNPLARPVSRVINAGGTNYTYNFAYNSIGKLSQLTYPTSTSSYRLKLLYEYQNSRLVRIKDFNVPTTVFWTANSANPREQVTQETLLNGVVSNRAFDAVTGWVKSIQSGVGGGAGVQNLEYAWDQVGNLSSRKDKNQANLTESFVYDNLYRLKSATLSTGPSLTYDYDALGNLTNKSDVGAYVYHATKKHQVMSTGAPTSFSFGYDLNGNMTSGRGATIDWTSYNYPSCIRLGAACTGSSSDYSSFSYTPDRQYWRQISNYTSGGTATTLYIGGLLEKVTTSSGTDYRHYIRAGGSTIIVSRQSTGTNSINYVTSDQLGSSSAITNSSGGILVNSSFDAFGRRRGANWTGSPSAGDWTAIASTTRRGFTEHTMLDNLNLTHMNGRVYDQVIGRFLSGDPFVTEPLNTQNYNRYSYVSNNPMSFTDPSGFASGVYFGDWHYWGCMGDNCTPGFDYTVWSDAAIERVAMTGAGDPMTQPEYGGPTDTWVPDTSAKDAASWSACVRPDLATNASWPNGESRAPESSAVLLVVHGVLGVAAASEWPLVSQAAGGLDAGVSLLEGDHVGAGLSVAGMVPGAGVAPDLAKLGRLGTKAARGAEELFLRASKAGPRLSGELPHSGQLREMGTAHLSELRDMTQMSLKTRTREISQLGDKGGHGRRIGEERRLLRNLEEELRNRGAL